MSKKFINRLKIYNNIMTNIFFLIKSFLNIQKNYSMGLLNNAKVKFFLEKIHRKKQKQKTTYHVKNKQKRIQWDIFTKCIFMFLLCYF